MRRTSTLAVKGHGGARLFEMDGILPAEGKDAQRQGA